MTDTNALLSDELLQKVEETARAQHRKPAEVVTEAVSKYLDEQSWVKFVENNERRAKAMGITEDDVDRLIQEYRAENPQHGR
jgi:predicted transcriptional regulator